MTPARFAALAVVCLGWIVAVSGPAAAQGADPMQRFFLICESDPITAACKAPPAASVSAQVNGGQTPTFSIFASATGPVAFDPAANRIFVEFSAGGLLVGRTSVAVRTP